MRRTIHHLLEQQHIRASMRRREIRITKWVLFGTLLLILLNIMSIIYFQTQTVMVFRKLIPRGDLYSGTDSGTFTNSSIRRLEDNDINLDTLVEVGDKGLSVHNGMFNAKVDDGNLRNCGDAVEEYEMRDDVIDAMIANLTSSKVFPAGYGRMSLHDLVRSLCASRRSSAPKLRQYTNRTCGPEDPSWQQLHHNIRQFSLYDPADPAVDGVLYDLAALPILKTEEHKGGSEFKLIAHLENGGKAILKPMRYSREVEADPNRFIFHDIERHIAEIAAFQLDRILGFCRVPPTVGRNINMPSELTPILPESVKATMFVSPAGNTCFYGKCIYFCDGAHAFCGHPDTIEVSMMSFLPDHVPRKVLSQPYKASYNKRTKAYWETHDDLCVKLMKQHPYNNGKLLADIIDAHTFDFLTGNNDRHTFVFFKEFQNYTFPIMFDNGRGFGRKTYDQTSILAPLRQCCMIRKSTLLKYVKVYQGPDKLSDLMERALANDPVAPVLIRGHLTALDRRLLKILRTVATCLETRSISDVIIDDGF